MKRILAEIYPTNSIQSCTIVVLNYWVGFGKEEHPVKNHPRIVNTSINLGFIQLDSTKLLEEQQNG